MSLEDDMAVIAQAETGQAAIELACEQLPDVIIMDISMPDMNGIEATRQILKCHPDIRIIALSVHNEKEIVLAMIQAGAKGYLLKTNYYEHLIEAIHCVMAGEIFLSPGITRYLVEPAVESVSREQQTSFDTLTARERQVLQMIAEGRSISYISDHLFISKKTVSAHRLNIMKKLDMHNVPDLTKFAIRHGITSLDT